MEHQQNLWDEFSSLARDMSSSDGVHKTMQIAVDGVTELVDSVSSAAVSMVHGRRRIDTPAATDQACRLADELQYELDEGPCVQSIRQHETVHSVDLTTEPRWPSWAARVSRDFGFRSMLCVQLFVADDTLGALNLYSNSIDGFDDEDRATALAVASHVAVALRSAHESEGLSIALAGRTAIG